MKNILNKNAIIIGFGYLFFLVSCNHFPKNNFNKSASISKTSNLPINPLLKKVITITINSKTNTMSTLYGNNIAWNYISSHNGLNYPKGSKLYEVTWLQQSDSVWFGAKIPKKIIKIECLIYTDLKTPRYLLYKGYPLKKAANTANSNYKKRIKEIIEQRFAATP